MSGSSVGIAMLTYNAGGLLPRSLPPLIALEPKVKILVVDSSSTDNTVAFARSLGVETFIIPQSDFNHGTTRELARKALKTDIAVMMTHDAIAVGSDMVANLVAPILSGKAAAAYARQIAHDGAEFFEKFPRDFNYPEVSEVRGARDISTLGPWTFFCSDSCCAWLNDALDTVGGFTRTLSLEDTIAAAKLVHAGYNIAYCADAVVKHSHHYSLLEEMKRHFDSGYVRSLHRDIFFGGGGDGRRGAAFSTAMLKAIWREKPQLLPYGFAVLVAKLLGYRLGYQAKHFPLWLVRQLSGQPHFWRKDIASGQRG